MELKWPAVSCSSVPWALHTPLCSLQSWSNLVSMPNLASSLTLSEAEQEKIPPEIDMEGRPDISKEEVGNNLREDGELPSLVTSATVANDVTKTPSKGSDYEHSRRLALISKRLASPINKGKSPSFRKNDEDLYLMPDSGSEIDEPAQIEQETEIGRLEIVNYSWVDCAVQEYCFVLDGMMDVGDKNMQLQAKVKIFMEYPVRPPLFELSLSVPSPRANQLDTVENEWYNELRAMEAEVNVHIIKMIPSDENLILGHQVRFLAMLFDFYMDNGPERRENTCVVDVGLCKPVNGGLIARSFRGRDRRKMISWKSNGCTSGYPC